MKPSLCSCTGRISCLALFTAFATCAHAAVTNVAWYRLGENDPGAASGLTVTNTTADIVGVNHLKQFGSPLYTNAISPAASNRVGSSLAIRFNGANQSLSNAIVSLATNNFGIELWVRPDTTNAGPPYFIALNGNSAGGGSSGWGIFQQDRDYRAIFPGVTVFGSFGTGTATPGIWDHVALVRASGTSTLYVNGISVATSALNPRLPTIGFSLGTHPNLPAGEFFGGAIDEVRVFTFAPGQFSTNDLLINLQRVVTLPATGVMVTNATLNGEVNPLGHPTVAWFEWGTTTNYGNTTMAQSVGSGTSNTNFSQVITGLVGGVTYHFRAVASNSFGLVSGTNQSFTTPVFANINAGLPNISWTFDAGFVSVQHGAVWGDYDGDGRLDMVLPATNFLATLWRNTGAGFTNQVPFSTNRGGRISWTDFNNDNRLDLLSFEDLWLNTGAGYQLVPSAQSVPPLGFFYGDANTTWVDYDGNGTLDVLFTGNFFSNNAYHAVTRLVRNTGAAFTEVSTALPPITWLSAWGDYDNDGRPDVMLGGRTNFLGGASVYQLWRNTEAGFVTSGSLFPGGAAEMAWGDYDNDGWPDLFLMRGFLQQSQILRNTGGAFANAQTNLPGFDYGSVAWGDYDSDGRLDLLFTGKTNIFSVNGGLVCQLWRNSGTNFSLLENVGLPALVAGMAAWGDYDNDGRLDVLVVGYQSWTNANGGYGTNAIAQIWRNFSPATNSPPNAPAGLSVSASGQATTFAWNAAFDAQTPAAGLTYNLRVGTTPGGSEIVSPMAIVSTGRRLIVQDGNAGHRLARTISGLPLATSIYWSVQAVDTSFAGGPFSPEIKWTFGPMVETLPLIPLGTNSVLLQARVNPDATSAWFDWGFTTNLGFSTLSQAISTNVFTVISVNFQGLTLGTTYYFRAAASNSFGIVYGETRYITRGFVVAVTNLPALGLGTLAWGDYDNDARLDLLLAGHAGGTNVVTDVWRNSPTGFAAIGSGLSGVTGDTRPSALAWGDYNNDGRLDVLLAGGFQFVELSEIWRNTGAGFMPLNAGLPAVQSCTAEWGDVDNDGRLDFLLAGFTGGDPLFLSQIWRNTPGGFTNLALSLTPLADSCAEWGDYDNDGRLDLLMAGLSGFTFTPVTHLLRNTPAGLTNSNPIGLPLLTDGAIAWGDYDNDGRLDFLIAGNDGANRLSQLWRNTGSTFTNVPIAGLPGVFFCSLAWGDYDNDGRLDFLITGTTDGLNSGAITEIWRNTGTGFTPIGAGLPGVWLGTAAWGDYDDDGRLDIALMGRTATGSNIAQVFRNEMPGINSPPAAPTGLAMGVTNGVAIFSWNAASDTATPAAGLSYNIRAGTTPGGANLISPQAAANGYRRLPARGNAQMRQFALLNGLNPGQKIYWSVQAVDTGLAGGPFAPEASFTVDLLVETLPAIVLPPSAAAMRALVNPSATSAWFEWGTTTNLGTATPLQLIGSGSLYTNIQQVLSGLTPGVTYHFRGVASNNLGVVRGAIRSFAVAGFTSIQPKTNGLVEMNFGGPGGSAYLIEASTNLSNWKLIACRHVSSSPAYFVDPEAPWFNKRFYRFGVFPAFLQTLFEFEDNHTNFFSVLFRHPSFSGSTAGFVDTSPGAPNRAVVTNSFPVGLSVANALHVTWSFTNGAVNPWVRLSTSNAGAFGNPTIDFNRGFCFDLYTDRPLYLALGLRETDTLAPVGQNGGTIGPIEWVGGTVNNTTNPPPPLGRLITAGQWHHVCFFPPAEPVTAFTGDGILTSTTGRGVLEHLAIVPVSGTGVFNIYFGGFQTFTPLGP